MGGEQMSAQTAHTPGPWENKYPVIMAGSARLARIECTPEMDKYDEANARLIAAAPDLLEALHIVTSRLEVLLRYKAREQTQDFVDRMISVHPDLCQAKRVIAKAQGGVA
jgi:hypothetical protein